MHTRFWFILFDISHFRMIHLLSAGTDHDDTVNPENDKSLYTSD